MLKKMFCGILLVIAISVHASPSQIVIVRHGDKLEQPNTGPTLSPKGEVRAINFALYYLNKFAEPDYIFASNAAKSSTSIRELQTVAPLVNLLQQKHPDEDFPIMHPYSSGDYGKLADYIMTSKEFDGKQIVICWSHGKIPSLAKLLGVNQKLSKWDKDDFDSVYIIKYNHKGDVKDFEILHNQYPVKFNGNWTDMQAVLMRLK